MADKKIKRLQKLLVICIIIFACLFHAVITYKPKPKSIWEMKLEMLRDDIKEKTNETFSEHTEN